MGRSSGGGKMGPVGVVKLLQVGNYKYLCTFFYAFWVSVDLVSAPDDLSSSSWMQKPGICFLRAWRKGVERVNKCTVEYCSCWRCVYSLLLSQT